MEEKSTTTDFKAKLFLLGWSCEPVEKDDDVYTMEDWINNVKVGGFIDYDGFGDYAIDGYKYQPPCNEDNVYAEPWVYPSDVKKGKINMGFTHIVWYNR